MNVRQPIMPRPPRMMSRPAVEKRQDGMGRPVQTPNIISAQPSLIHRPSEKEKEVVAAPTITAKPQLTTNPKGESTRFMPTSLRVRRQAKGKAGQVRSASDKDSPSTINKQKEADKKRKSAKSNADVAYDSFMKEMQGLL